MNRYFVGVVIAAACLLMLSSSKAGAISEEQVLTEEQSKILSLTVFPVGMADRVMKNVAEALGLVLEKKGFQGTQIADKAFKPQAGATWNEITTAFGDFVSKNAIKTEHALFGQFLGSPKEGVKCVRGVVVDKKGRVVWTDSQTPEDPAFKSLKPSCPLTCCNFLCERLSPELLLSESDKEGPMAKLWAHKSNLPGRKELDAIKKRQSALKKTDSKIRLAVFSVRLGKKVDRKGAEHLAGLINEAKLCTAAVAGNEVWFDIKPDSNQQRVLWDMAHAFKDHMKKKAPDADYALYADYMLNPRDGRVAAVHFVICSRQGEWIVVDFQNSHHGDFKRIAPKGCEGCNRLTVERLRGYLK